MGEIGAIELLPKALKSCPKSNKSTNLVTLVIKPKTIWLSHLKLRENILMAHLLELLLDFFH